MHNHPQLIRWREFSELAACNHDLVLHVWRNFDVIAIFVIVCCIGLFGFFIVFLTALAAPDQNVNTRIDLTAQS